MTALRHHLTALLTGFDFIAPALAQHERAAAILARSDRDAIAHDWQAVGNDLRQAMTDIELAVLRAEAAHVPVAELPAWLRERGVTFEDENS